MKSDSIVQLSESKDWDSQDKAHMQLLSLQTHHDQSAVSFESAGFEGAILNMKADRECQGVVVAGTFDRLHLGHTQLLSKALSLVAQGGRLIVGISNGKLLASKTLSEVN